MTPRRPSLPVILPCAHYLRRQTGSVFENTMLSGELSQGRIGPRAIVGVTAKRMKGVPMRRFVRGTYVTASVLTLALCGCGLAPVPLEEPEPEAEPTVTVTQPSDVEPDDTTTTTDTATTSDTGVTSGRTGDATEENGLEVEPQAMVDVPADSYDMASEGMSADEEFYGKSSLLAFEGDTEEYGAIEEGGFTLVATSPLSTVSADVDTASYANLRRMLMEGRRVRTSVMDNVDRQVASTTDEERERLEQLWGEPLEDYYLDQYDVIPAGAVRIEEMINYFDYDYDLPYAGGDDFAITARMGPCPWNEDSKLLVLGFRTVPEPETVRAAGANLVFLIDVSGSMDSPDKLDLLKSSFAELTKSLTADDVVSIVTYSGEERVVLEGVAGNDERQIMRAVRGLSAEGSTNGEAGLKMAYEVCERNFIDGGVNRIIMASDGDLNVGMTSESDLHDFVDQKRESGVYLSVLGFGEGNYKDNKMETLADHGNGSYHYIDCESEARRVFEDKLMQNLVPFADDTKLQVEFNPANVSAYRLIGYENRTMAAEEFLDDARDAGEVGPDAEFTVAYEVIPAGSSLEAEVPELKYQRPSATSVGEYQDEWATATVRYKLASTGVVRSTDAVVRSSDLVDDPGEDWRLCGAVCEFGMLLRDSEYKGTSSYDEIRELVGDTTDELAQEFLDLVDRAEKN